MTVELSRRFDLDSPVLEHEVERFRLDLLRVMRARGSAEYVRLVRREGRCLEVAIVVCSSGPGAASPPRRLDPSDLDRPPLDRAAWPTAPLVHPAVAPGLARAVDAGRLASRLAHPTFPPARRPRSSPAARTGCHGPLDRR